MFIFSTVNIKYVHYKILLMTGLKPWTSAIASDRSSNWATTTAHSLILLCTNLIYFPILRKVGSSLATFRYNKSFQILCTLSNWNINSIREWCYNTFLPKIEHNYKILMQVITSDNFDHFYTYLGTSTSELCFRGCWRNERSQTNDKFISDYR